MANKCSRLRSRWGVFRVSTGDSGASTGGFGGVDFGGFGRIFRGIAGVLEVSVECFRMVENDGFGQSLGCGKRGKVANKRPIEKSPGRRAGSSFTEIATNEIATLRSQ